MGIFERQLGSVSGRVAVICEPSAVAKYRDVIAKRGNVLIIDDSDSISSAAESAVFDLVIVVGSSIASTLRLYAEAKPFKEKGIPVVFGIQERSLFFEAPDWRSVDLHMDGMFYLTANYIRQIGRKGSYVEFGVFDGRSFSLAYHVFRNVCDDFFAFDSFQGIIGSREDERRCFGDSMYFANIETFEHNMRLVGADTVRIHTIEGAFQKTLTRPPSDYGISSVSVCHIDSDIYEAAYLALSFVEPVLLNGAMILLDEYHALGCDPNNGERRAVAQWLAENPGITLEHYRNYTAFASAFVFRRR